MQGDANENDRHFIVVRSALSDARVQKTFRTLIASGHSWEGEFLYAVADGYQMHFFLTKNGDRGTYYSLVVDVRKAAKKISSASLYKVEEGISSFYKAIVNSR